MQDSSWMEIGPCDGDFMMNLLLLFHSQVLMSTCLVFMLQFPQLLQVKSNSGLYITASWGLVEWILRMWLKKCLVHWNYFFVYCTQSGLPCAGIINTQLLFISKVSKTSQALSTEGMRRVGERAIFCFPVLFWFLTVTNPVWLTVLSSAPSKTPPRPLPVVYPRRGWHHLVLMTLSL